MIEEPLARQKCVPCTAETPAVSAEAAAALLPQIPGWTLEGVTLRRAFRFKDFAAAMAFVNRVAERAEAEGHHPDIHIAWNRVRLELTTHAIKGLSENDFILAAKINALRA
jgi:4a-hydroxytetrahydrobiopterin dehydratase